MPAARKRFDLPMILIYAFLSLFSIACLLPMILTLMVSFTDEQSILLHGYQLWPDRFSFDAYEKLWLNSAVILRSYAISITVTIGGSLIALLLTGMAAYTLSNPSVKYRGPISLYFFITMLFTGGLVPWYIVCTKLGLTNNIFALIVPGLMFNAFNLFLVRNFMDGLPGALRESAYIDGANDMRIAFQIYLPLCIPVLATVFLFYALAYWNDWFNAIMLVDDQKLYPLQYVLFKIRSTLEMLKVVPSGANTGAYRPPTESTKMATVIITVGPIVFLYPYLQRYFVKGLVIGSVKG